MFLTARRFQANARSVKDNFRRKFSTNFSWKSGEEQLKNMKTVLQNLFDALKYSSVPNNCLYMKMS